MNAKLQSSKPLSNQANDVKNFDYYLKNKNRVACSIYLSECSSDEILKIINSFENDKASDMSVVVLKRCANYISGHLSEFMNYFMQAGIFPQILKIGKITPIYKKDDSQLFENYYEF